MGGVRALMIFVEDPAEVAAWWAAELGGGAPVRVVRRFAYYEVDGVEFGFHPADEVKNPPGGSTVPYLPVADTRAERERLVAAGCRAHRGPLHVEGERWICQLVDPFGTVFGLDDG